MIAYNLKYNELLRDWTIFEWVVPSELQHLKFWTYEEARQNLELYRRAGNRGLI